MASFYQVLRSSGKIATSDPNRMCKLKVEFTTRNSNAQRAANLITNCGHSDGVRGKAELDQGFRNTIFTAELQGPAHKLHNLLLEINLIAK